jgi:hypothetical protein
MKSSVEIKIEVPYSHSATENLINSAVSMSGWQYRRDISAHPYKLNTVVVSLIFNAMSPMPIAENFRRLGYRVVSAETTKTQ